MSAPLDPGAFPTTLSVATSGYVGLANQHAYRFDVSGLPGSTAAYTITDGIGSITGTLTLDASGHAGAGLDLSGLADGTLTSTVIVTDSNGNPDSPVATTLTKDTIPPAAPAISLDPRDDTGVSNSDWITAVSAPRLTAIGETGARASIYVNGVLYTGQSLPDGVYTVGATLTDAAGNTSAVGFAAQQLVIDTTAPTGSFSISGSTVVNGQAATNNRSLALQLAFADAGSRLTTVSLSTDGGQTYPVSEAYAAFEAVALGADGLYVVAVRVSDAAGNSYVATQSIRLDTSGPVITDSLSSPANSGSYDVGQNVTFTYTASDVDGATATATLDSKLVLASGATFNTETLLAGSHTIVVVATDSLGNRSTSTVAFQVHATAGGLITAVNDGLKNGQITCNASNMITKLQAAQAAYARGDNATAKGLLNTFLNQVSSQAGKGISSSYAALLTNWTQDLISRT